MLPRTSDASITEADPLGLARPPHGFTRYFGQRGAHPAGTTHLEAGVETLTDHSGATVTSPVTFAAGQATSAITFKASGTHAINATLVAPGSGSGTGIVNVAPGTADHCTMTQVPGSATAGAVLGARVTFFEPRATSRPDSPGR